MSSSDHERRRSRRGSKKQNNTSGPRHFRDEKTSVKKAPVEPEEPAVETAAPEELIVPSDSEHHSHHSHHSDSEHHSHHSHHSDSEHHSHHSHDSDSEHHSHHSHDSDSEHHSHHSHDSDSEHHSHHSHHSDSEHHSQRAENDVVSMWDVEGEQGWTDTAGVKTKKIEKADAEPEVVAPVEKENRVSPEKMKTADEPETAFDYVVPKQTFQQHLKNPQKSTTHTGKTKTATREELEEAEEGFVFRSLAESDKKKHRRHHHHHHHHHHSSSEGDAGENTSGSDASSMSSGETSGSGSGKRKKRRRHHHHRLPRWARIVIIVLCVLLAIIIALISTYFILKEIGRRSMHTIEENINIVVPVKQETGEKVVDIEVIDKGRTIVHEGKSYRVNNDVVCVAFIGINVDYDEEGRTLQPMGDAINLIALDTETGKLSVIGVSRDTMAYVRLYSSEDRFIENNEEKMQLSYAYSFDSETVSGGENTAASLSKLFYGLPVDHYFAINLDALITLNDAIGGVTLTSSMDFSTSIRDISAGETVTLHGKEVEYYVRHREHTVEGNNGRMKRQQEYIQAFLSQVIPAVKKDLSMVSELYNIIRANSSSNLDLPKIIYLASQLSDKLGSTSDIDYYILKGKAVEGEEHTEFIVDDNNVLETLLQVFYVPES